MLEMKIPSQMSQMLLKQYLQQHCGFSLTYWRKIKHSGVIYVNDQLVEPHTTIFPDDIIKIDVPSDCKITPLYIPLSIAYEDEYLIIIDKPANLLVHPATFNNASSLANGIMYYYQQKGWDYGFHPIHRLDRNTSGLILIAKAPYIQHLLSQHQKITRLYQAVVAGTFSAETGSIHAPIARKPQSIIERIVDETGKPATTNYKVLETYTDASLLELQLLSGRTHQIRVHLSYIGHPLYGDDLYGGNCSFINRQALHAARTIFLHPITKQLIDLSSPLPQDIKKVINMLQQ